MANGKLQLGWMINIIKKNDDGFVFELANLGNGKHMIVATDTGQPIADNSWRQAGFGPFIYDNKDDLNLEIESLKEHLLTLRI